MSRPDPLCVGKVRSVAQDKRAAKSIRLLKYRLSRVLSELALFEVGCYPRRLVDLDWIRGALCSRKRHLESGIDRLVEARKEWRQERNGQAAAKKGV